MVNLQILSRSISWGSWQLALWRSVVLFVAMTPEGIVATKSAADRHRANHIRPFICLNALGALIGKGKCLPVLIRF